MRFGYSLLAGAALEARDISYDDTRDQQVVCPCCHEPLIKAIRKHADHPGTHFLKHHKAASSDAEQARQDRCEHRTSMLPNAAAATAMAQVGVSRGQDINGFLEVLAERIDRVLSWWMEDPPNLGTLPNNVELSRLTSAWRSSELREDFLLDMPKEKFIHNFQEVSNLETSDRPSYDPDNLIEFCEHVWNHLRTEAAEPNLRRLELATMLAYVLNHGEYDPSSTSAQHHRDQYLRAYVACCLNLSGHPSPRVGCVEAARAIAHIDMGRRATKMPQHEVLAYADEFAVVGLKWASRLVTALVGTLGVPQSSPPVVVAQPVRRGTTRRSPRLQGMSRPDLRALAALLDESPPGDRSPELQAWVDATRTDVMRLIGANSTQREGALVQEDATLQPRGP